MNDLLTELRELRGFLGEVKPDHVSGLSGGFLNRAKNKLMKIIADGERRVDEKLSREMNNGQ